ncbi:MAG TPA: hypothetical protein VIV40_37215 [Kofleriaceae bacterium]
MIRFLLQRPWLALVLALLVETIIYWLGQIDFVASDPLWYANIAHGIAVDPDTVFSGTQTHPFVMRIGLTLPIALAYKLFGVSSITTNLPCLVAALGITAIVYAAAPTARAKWLGMIICACCIALLRNMIILNVDLPCAALMAAAVLCLVRRWFVAAAVATVAAFLVKETALWCGVVWIYAIALELRERGWRDTMRAFAPGIAVGVALTATYLALSAHWWGNPFARFAGIAELTFEHAWTLHGRPIGEWINRLTWQTPLLLVTVVNVLIVPALLAPWLAPVLRRSRDRIWIFATASFLLLYWFGSSSMSAYAPLPISPRMILPVLPGVLVLATFGCDGAVERLQGSRWRTPVIAVFMLALVVPAGRVMFGMLRRGHPEADAFALLRRETADPQHRVLLVCGEPRCTSIASYYFGFMPRENFTVTFAGDFAAAPLPANVSVRALVNKSRSPGARRTDPKLDRTEQIDALALPKLVTHRSVRLYDAGDGARLWQALQSPP